MFSANRLAAAVIWGVAPIAVPHEKRGPTSSRRLSLYPPLVGSLVPRRDIFTRIRVALQESYTAGANPCFPFAGRLHLFLAQRFIRSLGARFPSLTKLAPVNSTFSAPDVYMSYKILIS
jgi:hypothetical protein